MSDSEFDIIERYFQRPASRADVSLGIGDDAALLLPPAGLQLAVSVDLLVADVHFFADADPRGIGHKALAVNLSDMAAMGAEPAWVTLAISLPRADKHWLAGFCEGFFSLADRHGVQLVGGDTTRGPLSISVQIHGFVPPGLALRRDGARPGDRLLVTGVPGEAALGLAGLQGRVAVPERHRTHLLERLERPTPRVRQGLDLRGLASAAMDISDGLAQDLCHILRRSRVGARLALAQLPSSTALQSVDPDLALTCQLSGGDDYELLLAVPPVHLVALRQRAVHWDCTLSDIGEICATEELQLVRADGSLYHADTLGFDHFGRI